MVSFDFSGTVQSIDDPGTLLPADITVGQAYSGRVTYNVARVSDSQSDPANGVYDFVATAQNDFSLNVIIGSHTISSQPTPNLFGNYIQISLAGTHYLDYAARFPQLDGATPPGNISDYAATLSLSENLGTLTSDALLTGAPVLSGFPGALFSLSANNGADNYTIYTDVQSITPVPEPAYATLAVGFALAGLSVCRHSFRRVAG